MNWKYVPFAGFLLFTLLVSLIRYYLMPELSLKGHSIWFMAQFALLLIIWYSVRTIARYLDKKISYTESFSRRVLVQVLTSLVLITPPVYIVFKFLEPHLPPFFSRQFIALTWILLFVLIVLMNVGLAAGIFFSNWQYSIKEITRVEAERKSAELELLQIKQKQGEIEMKALRAQMNPHFIFNSLNSINKYILKNDQINASRYLTRFAKLIRLILDNSNSREVALSSELEALKLYIEMEALRFTNKFKYELLVEENLSADTLQVPPLIMQPFVENAIWHGLLHKESEGKLMVEVKKTTDNMLQCTIEDNGIGRTRALEMKSKSANTNKSMGMQLTEERISMLNRFTSVDASIQIIDLLNSGGDAAGTRVILKIPI